MPNTYSSQLEAYANFLNLYGGPSLPNNYTDSPIVIGAGGGEQAALTGDAATVQHITIPFESLTPSHLMTSPIPMNPDWGVYDEPDMIPKLKTRTMTKDTEEFYNRKLSTIVSFRPPRPKGLIGLEIECEGTHLFNTPFQYWTCHSDGSLRETQGHPPIEYVLKEPLNLDELKSALVYLETKLRETGSSVQKSQRTSVHVHVNCQQMTIRELYCYICLYLIFEELLVDYVGPERSGNLFCLRAKDSEYYITMLEQALKTNTIKNWREDYRYTACNVASIPKFGSLEFRAMQGTVDVQQIMTWVNLLVGLREASQKYDNPIEIVDDFVMIGPLPFLKKIFKDQKLRSIFENSQGLSGKLWDGLRLMRDVAYSCEWKPMQKKTPRSRKKT